MSEKRGFLEQLQRDLNVLGAGLEPDGDFGPLTRKAVLAIAERLTGKATDIVTASLAETIRKAVARAAKAG